LQPSSYPLPQSDRKSLERSWDAIEGVVETKSRSGRYRVPIVEELRSHLAEHLVRTGPRESLVFVRDASRPFAYGSLINRARRAWEESGLEPIGLHECRHTFASMCIAAGVNARGLMAYLGHASIQMLFDRCGHLIPGNESEDAELLNAHLRRSGGAARARRRRDSDGVPRERKGRVTGPRGRSQSGSLRSPSRPSR
jgi:integrase